MKHHLPLQYFLKSPHPLTRSLLAALALASQAHALPVGNLLVNGSGAAPLATGWTTLENGGNGWGLSTTGGYDDTPGFFISSYVFCTRSQLVDLVAAGATPEELDQAPIIRVGEAISHYANGNPDQFFIKVELRDANQNVIATWNAGTRAAPLVATLPWVYHEHEFTNYGPGVRYVYFEDGGIDIGYWGGQYGSYHDAASVEFFEDTDGDGLPNNWEELVGTNPDVDDADADPDNDWLSNIEEYRIGTDPLNPDTDDDGLLDGDETMTGIWITETDTGTNPLVADSDGDGLLDGVENPDLPFLNASQTGTDPNKADSDGDGYPDPTEINLGSDPTDSASVPTFTFSDIMRENFDGGSFNSTYHFTNSGGAYIPSVSTTGIANQNAARLTETQGSANNSIAWDYVRASATAIQLQFDFRMSADSGGEAADGIGIGLFRTSAFGETGPSNPAATGAEWETPGGGTGLANGVHFGFDIYGGGNVGNNIRVSGPANPKTVLANFPVPTPLNSGQFHRAVITGISTGTSTLFNVDLITDVNGTPQTIPAIRGMIVPGFDVATESFRIIAGGRTGGATVRSEIDNLVLRSTDVSPEPEKVTITSVTRSGNVLTLIWNSQPGSSYIISYSDDLTLWQDFPSPVSSVGMVTTFQDTLGATPPAAKFYRIRPAP